MPTIAIWVQCRSAQMSKITNDGLTWSDTGCFITVLIWQQWVSRVKIELHLFLKKLSFLYGLLAIVNSSLACWHLRLQLVLHFTQLCFGFLLPFDLQLQFPLNFLDVVLYHRQAAFKLIALLSCWALFGTHSLQLGFHSSATSKQCTATYILSTTNQPWVSSYCSKSEML